MKQEIVLEDLTPRSEATGGSKGLVQIVLSLMMQLD